MKSCILLTECVDLNTSDLGMGCPNCISGERECDEPESSLRCWVPGRCNGRFVGLEPSEFDLFNCLPACQDNPACNYFTFDASKKVLHLLHEFVCYKFFRHREELLICLTIFMVLMVHNALAMFLLGYVHCIRKRKNATLFSI